MPRGGRREDAGRKPKWKHGKSIAIRVPEVFAERLVEIAKKLDSGESIDFVSESKPVLADAPIDLVVGVLPGDTGMVQMNLLEAVIEEPREAPMVLPPAPGDLVAPHGLTEAALSRRLKSPKTGKPPLDSSSLSKARKKRTPEDFLSWSRDKDIDGLGWRYDESAKRYFQTDYL